MVAAVVAKPVQSKPESWLDKTSPAGVGASKLARLVKDALAVISKFFAQIPQQLVKLSDIVGSCKIVLGVVDLALDIKYWICDFSAHATRWQKTATKVATTIIGVINTLYFFRAIKAFDCVQLLGQVKNIPVFGTILSGAYLFSGIFGTWNSAIELRGSIGKYRDIEKKILQTKEELKVNAEPTKKASLDQRLVQLTAELKAEKTNRTKCWIALTYSIANLVFSALATIGLLGGIAALSLTGWPMMIPCLAISAYAMFRFIFEQAHPKAEKPKLAAAAA